MTRPVVERRRAFVGLAILLLGLIAIGATFAAGIATASGYFDRAAITQTQLATVSQIEATWLSGEGDARALDVLLADYRRSIDREAALIGGVASAAQRQEATEARELARLAHQPANAPDLRRLIARIAQRERGEAQDVAADMHRLRQRMLVLAVSMTVGAVLLALVGGWALLSTNRTLEEGVAARTADLAASNARLVEIDRSRRLFFAKTSHELRTPLTALRGEAEVALDDPAPTIARMRDALGHIGVQVDLLGRRVEDLLALARADDGRITLNREPFDLLAAVAQAVDQATPHALAAGVVLSVDIPAAAMTIMGDAKWMVQALVAILDNGAKFAPSGSALTLAANRRGDIVTMAVVDRGPGVLPVDLPRVFDAYYQTAAGASRGGTGLGLALARWVVEQHGGTIAARNDNPGCTILIDIPVAA